MDRTDIAREPSRPTHYAPIYKSGRTGLDYPVSTFRFTDCGVPTVHMANKGAESGFQAGCAFLLANGSRVIARPGGRAVRLERAL